MAFPALHGSSSLLAVRVIIVVVSEIIMNFRDTREKYNIDSIACAYTNLHHLMLDNEHPGYRLVHHIGANKNRQRRRKADGAFTVKWIESSLRSWCKYIYAACKLYTSEALLDFPICFFRSSVLPYLCRENIVTSQPLQLTSVIYDAKDRWARIVSSAATPAEEQRITRQETNCLV